MNRRESLDRTAPLNRRLQLRTVFEALDQDRSGEPYAQTCTRARSTFSPPEPTKLQEQSPSVNCNSQYQDMHHFATFSPGFTTTRPLCLTRWTGVGLMTAHPAPRSLQNPLHNLQESRWEHHLG